MAKFKQKEKKCFFRLDICIKKKYATTVLRVKNYHQRGGSTVDMVETIDMVYTVHMVYANDMV